VRAWPAGGALRRATVGNPGGGCGFFPSADLPAGMRSEEEVREQYEFLKEELDDEDMRHEGVRQMFTYYRRALGWVLEEEHI